MSEEEKGVSAKTVVKERQSALTDELSRKLNRFDQSSSGETQRNQTRRFSALRRSESSPAVEHAAVHINGTQSNNNISVKARSQTLQVGAKKMPLFPPSSKKHGKAHKTDSCGSTASQISSQSDSSSFSAGSKYSELSAQYRDSDRLSSNRDARLSDVSSISISPCLSPTLREEREDEDNCSTGVSQSRHTPLPSTPQTTPPPDSSPAPSEQGSKFVVGEAMTTSGSDGEGSKVSVLVDNLSHRHRPVLRSSVSVPNQMELELDFEREAMSQLNLDQRNEQCSLTEKGHLLRLLNVIGIRSPPSSQISPAQASPTPITGLSGPETGCVTQDECTNVVPTGSYPSVTVNGAPPTKGSNMGSKELARLQLTRVIEQKQQQHKQQSQPQQKPKASGLPPIHAPPPISKTSKTTDDLIRSPRSSSSPTPSLVNLVSFGQASQVKRNRERAATEGVVKTSSDGMKGDITKQTKKPILPPQLSKGLKKLHGATSSSMEVVREATQQEISSARVGGKEDKMEENIETKGNLLDVKCTNGNGAEIMKESQTYVRSASHSSRKESESDDVFANRNESVATATNFVDHPIATATDFKEPTSQSRAKSDSNILCTLVAEELEGKPSAAGVTVKKIALKSDHSWIRRKKSLEIEDSSKLSQPVSLSQPTAPGSSSPIPYRSHAILPTKPPPSQAILPPTSTSQPALPDTKSSRKPPTTAVPNRTHSPKVPNRAHSPKVPNRAQSPKVSNRAHHSVSPSPSNSKKGDKKLSGKDNKGKGRKGEKSVTQSSSEENLNRVVLRGEQAPRRPPPPLRITDLKDLKMEGSSGRPSSMVLDSSTRLEEANEPQAYSQEDQFTSSCTVPPNREKSPKGKFKKSPDLTALKRGIGRLRGKTKPEKDQLHAPGGQRENEDSDSSSEDEKGGTIKFKPALRRISIQRVSMIEDDFDSSYPQLFERVFVVGLKVNPVSKKLETEVTYAFPPKPTAETARDETMEAIPQFCFPDIDQLKKSTSYKSETFSFVLTNMEGDRRFGYCRRTLPSGEGARYPEVTCLISPLGCFSLYAKILEHIEARRLVSSSAVFTFLKAIVANPFPKPGRSVRVKAISARGTGMETVTFTRPLDSRLEHVDFSLLFTTLSTRKIIQLFSSVLMERRIILCSSNLSLLSGCVHALLALLYPFEWQHVFIPVLPGGLIDFCCSPLPYIIGLNASLIPSLDAMETMEEALVVNLDKKKFSRKIGDEVSILPSKLFQYLEHTLGSAMLSEEYHKKMQNKSSTARADETVINTFLIFFVYLYGDYKDYMKRLPDGSMEFQRKEYEKKFSSKSTSRFLEAFHMTQMFENFIEQRENPKKVETTAQSEFEKHSIPEMREKAKDIEEFSSKSKMSRWRLKRGIGRGK